MSDVPKEIERIFSFGTLDDGRKVAIMTRRFEVSSEDREKGCVRYSAREAALEGEPGYDAVLRAAKRAGSH